jgi:ubiquitin C-terminal hydrolase
MTLRAQASASPAGGGSSNWIMEGFLEKGAMFRNLRYFYLSERGKLCYCDAPTQTIKQTLYIGEGSSVTFQDEKRRCQLTRVLPSDMSKVYDLTAPTTGEYNRWRNAFRRVLASTASAKAQVEYDQAVYRLLDNVRRAFAMALKILATDEVNSSQNEDALVQPLRPKAGAIPQIDDEEGWLTGGKAAWVERFSKITEDASGPLPLAHEDVLRLRAGNSPVEFGEALRLQTMALEEQRARMAPTLVSLLALAVSSLRKSDRLPGEHSFETLDVAADANLFDPSLPTGSVIASACAAFQAERERLAESHLVGMWRRALGDRRYEGSVSAMPPLEAAAVQRLIGGSQWLVPSLIVDVLHDEAHRIRACGLDGRFSADPGAGMCGLQNLGNTCFLNAALQCLLHTPQVKRFLLMRKLEADATDRRKAEPLIEELVGLSSKMWTRPRGLVDPSKLRAEFDRVTFGRFTEAEEHDSHEALLALLDGMHDELNASNTDGLPYRVLPDRLGPTVPTEETLSAIWWSHHTERNQSLIQSLFHGQTRQTVSCLHCGSASYCCDAFQFLMLSFPQRTAPGGEGDEDVAAEDEEEACDTSVSLESLVETYFAEETLTKEGVRCDRCQQVRPCRKQVVMSRAPTYLIMCLKRFRSNKYGQLVAKNSTPVSIPLEMDLSRFSSASATSSGVTVGKTCHPRTFSGPSTDSDAGDTGSPLSDPFNVPASAQAYQLYAVVHHGGSISSGHYYATCLCRRKWFLFNDSMISAQAPDWLEHSASSAYILLFKKRK